MYFILQLLIANCFTVHVDSIWSAYFGDSDLSTLAGISDACEQFCSPIPSDKTGSIPERGALLRNAVLFRLIEPVDASANAILKGSKGSGENVLCCAAFAA